MTKKIRLKNTMNLFYALAIIVPLIIISLLSMNYAKTYIADLSKEFNEQVVRNLKQNIESFFEEPKKELNTLKELILLDEAYSRDFIIGTFYDAQRLFHHLLLIDKDGSVEFTYPKNEGVVGFDYSKEVSFEKISNGSETAWSKTYMYTRESFVSINYAVSVGEKVLLGVIHLDSLKDLFDKTLNDDEIILGITDETGVYIMHTNYDKVEQSLTDPFVNKMAMDYTKVKIDNETYYASSLNTDYQGWKIVIYEPTRRLQNRITEFMFYLSMLIIFMVAITVFIGLKFNKVIILNLNKVVIKTQEVRAGQYGLESERSPFIEFEEISQNFSAMTYEIKSREDQILSQKDEIESMNKELEFRVAERTEELFSANQELEIALENLKTTQNQLIESEKLASLGDLVAGLAHEINTPLGIVLTVTSYMQETTKKMKEIYDSGMLKKSDFDQHLITAADSESLVFDNITRAIELISSFKLISTEQRSTEMRTISLKEFMESVLRSVTPQLKKSHITTNLRIKDDIEITTIPLSLYQILVNLVMNSKIHAYDSSGGVVDIFVNLEYDGVEIIVQDYGSGISSDHIKKIFEPFFTTKRGSGGTGLGLNIVYNTVKQNLMGDIRCFSELGVGSQFVIHLPLKI